jgi:hypothetical protein
MQEYPIKKTHLKIFPEVISVKLKELFEIEPIESDGWYMISFGALESMKVRIGESKKTLIVETVSRTDIEDEMVILDTNRRFRKYLDEITGYTTKERVKKAKKTE